MSWWYLVTPTAILLYLIISPNPYQKAADRQQAIGGIIRDYNPAAHNSYGYEFSLNGITYKGRQIARPEEHFQIGEKVVVYYDPKSPTVNSLTNFELLHGSFLGPILFFSLVVAAMAFSIFVSRRESFRKTEGRPEVPS
jgi:hypothetical protein